jgi:two-component system, sensor histidine kinase
MSSQETILVVDDNESQRYAKTRILQSGGFRTIESNTGLGGLELARAHKPGLVLLDIKLPDIDGFEVCRRLREDPETVSIAIVQITASYERPEHAVRGLEGGADTFLVAPVDPTVLVATVRAMLRLRRAETALREADRRKDEFLAVLAHELRNPLAPLRTSLALFERSKLDDPMLQRARAIMERQISQMVRLIDDLLDVSRINQQKLELRKTDTTIAEILDSAVETSRPGLEAARHQLLVQAPAEPIRLYADKLRLAQVFANLLSNSSKYTAPGGRITVEVRRDGETAEVSVADTGIGIHADELPRVFDMFSQLRRDAELPDRGGLGIGLALVRRLVELHGGTVTARSGGVGKGATFTVSLPLGRTPVGASPPPVRVPETAPERSKRVLVVDDNADAASSLALLLEGMGHEVCTAQDGEHALDAARAFRPQVIFMDIAMPRVDGLEAARRIREEEWGQDVVICALTGFGQADDRERSRDAGITLHLVKPIDPQDVEGVLRT